MLGGSLEEGPWTARHVAGDALRALRQAVELLVVRAHEALLHESHCTSDHRPQCVHLSWYINGFCEKIIFHASTILE